MVSPKQHMSFDATKPVSYLSTIAFVRSNSICEYPPKGDHVVRLPSLHPSRTQNTRHHVFAGSFVSVAFVLLSFHFHIYALPTDCAANHMIWADSATLAIYRRQVPRLVLYGEIGSGKVQLHYSAEPEFCRLAPDTRIALPVLPTFQVLTSHWLRSPMVSIPTQLHERKARSCADRGTLHRCGGVLRAVSANVRHVSR